MSTSKEYKAVKNFFINTLHFTKQDLKDLLMEILAESAKEECRKYFRSNEFIQRLGPYLSNYRYGSFGDGIRADITWACQQIIKQKFDEMGMKITFENIKPINVSISKELLHESAK